MIAGRYFERFRLTPGETPSNEIDIASDSSAALAMTQGPRRIFTTLWSKRARFLDRGIIAITTFC